MAAEGPGTRVVGNLVVVGCIKKQTLRNMSVLNKKWIYTKTIRLIALNF